MERNIVGRSGATVRTYDENGYDRFGFNRAGLHRDTRTRWGPDGDDQDGNRQPPTVPMLTR